jgi:hypothetical protein
MVRQVYVLEGMMPKIISNREQLILYLASRIPYRYLVKALYDGEVENLGSFDIRGKAGWVVRIRTIINKVDYYVGISTSDGKYRMLIERVAPGWKYWVGDTCKNDLYRGDHPDKYLRLKEQELKNV